jgi:hypothetical protein
MAGVILAVVVVVLVVGLVIAVWAATRARRRFPLAFKPTPWSSVELEGLRGDLTDFGGPDPIAALARADAATHAGRSKTTPVTYPARRAEMAAIVALSGRRRERRGAGRRPRGRRRIPRNRNHGRLARTRETRNGNGSPAFASGRRTASPSGATLGTR